MALEVVVGTYEGFLLGYRLRRKNDEWSFKIDFADKCHSSTVKCVAAGVGSSVVASGSVDETVAVFDLNKRKCVGILQEHSTTVTAACFFGRKIALTGGEDGRLVVWNALNWSVLFEFIGHTGPVTGVAVHPSGKLALSVGKDKTLRTWNLLRGRSAYITNVKVPAFGVVYSKDGAFYALGLDPSRVDIYSTTTAGIVASVTSASGRRVLDMKFSESSRELAFTADSEVVELIAFDEAGKKEPKVRRFIAHDPRVKGLDFGSVETPEGTQNFLITCGTEGSVKLWDYKPKRVPTLITSVEAKLRFTCLKVTYVEPRPKQEDEEESSDEEQKEKVAQNGKEESEDEAMDEDEDEGDESGEDSRLERAAKSKSVFSKFIMHSRGTRSHLFFQWSAYKARQKLRERVKRKLLG